MEDARPKINILAGARRAIHVDGAGMRWRYRRRPNEYGSLVEWKGTKGRKGTEGRKGRKGRIG